MSSLAEEIANYQNQMSNYTDQVNQYKDMLTQSADEGSEMKGMLSIEGAMPLIGKAIEMGTTRIFGAEAAAQLSGLNLGNLLKGDVSDTLNALKSTLTEGPAGGSSLLDSLTGALTSGNPLSSLTSALTGQAEGGGLLDSLTSLSSGNPLSLLKGALTGQAEGGGLLDSLTGALTSGNPLGSLLDTAKGALGQAEGGGLLDSLTGLSSGNPLGSLISSTLSGLKASEQASEPIASFTVQNPAFNADFFGPSNVTSVESLGFSSAQLPSVASVDLEGPIAQFSQSWMTAGKATYDEAASMVSSFVEPLPSASLSSNVIGRLLSGGLSKVQSIGSALPEVQTSEFENAGSVLGSLMSSVRTAGGSALESASAAATEAFSGAVSSATGVAGSLGEAVSGITGLGLGLEQTGSGLTSSITSTLSSVSDAAATAASSLTAVAGITGETVAGVGTGLAAVIPEEVAASAEGGPAGLIVGGLIAIATTLASIFGHHDTAPPPPVLPNLSIPTMQQGLDTAN
jgi:hypothetical protein